jgi:hypothetical protein
MVESVLAGTAVLQRWEPAHVSLPGATSLGCVHSGGFE